VNPAIGIATEEGLNWLNDGFDNEAMSRLDVAYLDKAVKASPTPPHWWFPDIEPAGGLNDESALSS